MFAGATTSPLPEALTLESTDMIIENGLKKAVSRFLLFSPLQHLKHIELALVIESI